MVLTIKGKPLWTAIGAAAFLSFILLAAGFSMAVIDYFHPASSAPKPSAIPAEKRFSEDEDKVLVSLGDSLTRGTGDMSGKGYVGLVNEALKKTYGDRVTTINLGINGQTSADLAKQIRQPEVRQLLKRATWITITIGGNDLFRASGELDQVDRVAIDEGRTVYRRNLSRILKEIRKLNSEAPVFIYGLYNPFGDLSGQRETSRLVMEWNETIMDVSQQFSRIVVIPTFDLFQLNPSRLLYSDHFHPNQEGYRKMAERLLQAMEEKGGGDG
jgi:lysophospholipase L1-like esterase